MVSPERYSGTQPGGAHVAGPGPRGTAPLTQPGGAHVAGPGPRGTAPLTQPGEHALAETIAAERLEGWQPSEEHIAALAELQSEQITFGEYLSAAVTELVSMPQPRPRRALFARRRPYLIPGTSVLRNNFRVSDAALLAQLEFVATAGRMIQVHSRRQDRDLDVQQLHQHVFGDVYPWAGELRIVELRRGDSTFGSSELIADRLPMVGADITDLAESGAALDAGELAYRLARIYADYNQIHPFREGNGRTGNLLMHSLARRCGYQLHLQDVARAEWVAAARDSMPFRRDGRADPRPFVAILRPRLTADGPS